MSGPNDNIYRSSDGRPGLPSVLLAFIGALVVVRFVYSSAKLIYSVFLSTGISLRKFGEPTHTWAVVTGASDGLGKEYALQLAQKGFSVLLISRTESKLQVVADEIKQKYGTSTKTLAMDFAQDRPQDYETLTRMVEEICKPADQDIGILINNVGLSHGIPVSFVETPLPEMEGIVKINCLATLRVSRIVIDRMLQRQRKGHEYRGLVLTMGSFGGAFPTPLLATYSGSKAFLQHWSSALGSELASSGIVVELVQSYLVTSAMSKIRRTSTLIPSPKSFVRATLSSISQTRGAQGYAFTSTPYWSHALMQWAINCILPPTSNLVVEVNHRMHRDIRSRALRKKANVNVEGGQTKVD